MLAVIIIAASLLPCKSHGQEIPKLKSMLLQFDAGTNRHGSLIGYGFNLEASKVLKGRLTTSLGIGSTISQGGTPLTYLDAAGKAVDASYRITTAGFQVTSKLGLSWMTTQKFDLGTRIGLLARYESSSFFGDHTVYYPIVTGFPIPLSSIEQRNPQQTFALGGIAQMFLNYRVNKSTFIGLNASWQLDTEGNAIAQAMLHLGFRLFYE